jgi:hypothetical protein
MESTDLRCRWTEGRRSCGALRGSASALGHGDRIRVARRHREICRIVLGAARTQLRNPSAVAGGAPTPAVNGVIDLAAGGDRNLTRRYQNEIRDNSGKIIRQLAGGPIKICSRRIGGKVFITVVSHQVGGNNSKADLHKLAARTPAEFDLTGEID